MTDRRVQGRPLEILLVEDNPADVRLTELALEHTELHGLSHNARLIKPR